MKQFVDIYAIAQRLLSPNETLDLRLFDFSGRMHPEVRKQLLQNANYIINLTIGRIQGLVAKDVLLNGSAASYFYYDKSDIDLRIEIVNKNCPYITDDAKIFDSFLSTLKNGSLHNFHFNLDGRFVDIKLRSQDSEPMGLYSILDDKWIIEPNQRAVDNLDIDEIMTEYKQRYYSVKSYIDNLQQSGVINTKSGIDELIKYYTNIFDTNTISTKEYIIYKLLNYRGVTQDIRKLISKSLLEYYSLK